MLLADSRRNPAAYGWVVSGFLVRTWLMPRPRNLMETQLQLSSIGVSLPFLSESRWYSRRRSDGSRRGSHGQCQEADPVSGPGRDAGQHAGTSPAGADAATPAT